MFAANAEQLRCLFLSETIDFGQHEPFPRQRRDVLADFTDDSLVVVAFDPRFGICHHSGLTSDDRLCVVVAEVAGLVTDDGARTACAAPALGVVATAVVDECVGCHRIGRMVWSWVATHESLHVADYFLNCKVGNVGWLVATQVGLGDLESVGLAQVCIHRLDVATLGGGEWGDCGCGGLLVVVDWVVVCIVGVLLHLGLSPDIGCHREHGQGVSHSMSVLTNNLLSHRYYAHHRHTCDISAVR